MPLALLSMPLHCTWISLGCLKFLGILTLWHPLCLLLFLLLSLTSECAPRGLCSGHFSFNSQSQLIHALIYCAKFHRDRRKSARQMWSLSSQSSHGNAQGASSFPGTSHLPLTLDTSRTKLNSFSYKT